MAKENIEKAKQAKDLKNKLMLVSNPDINEKQLLHILQKTPSKYIYTRPGKGGGQFKYVKAYYVKKVLNYVFGWMWDFEIKEHGRESNQIWVLGRLTIKNKKGEVRIAKEQFGRADIKFYKDRTKGELDFGNDLKAAASDSLKKCASELGISSDVYNEIEDREIKADPRKETIIEADIDSSKAMDKLSKAKTEEELNKAWVSLSQQERNDKAVKELASFLKKGFKK
jgi:hypothetical protein